MEVVGKQVLQDKAVVRLHHLKAKKVSIVSQSMQNLVG